MEVRKLTKRGARVSKTTPPKVSKDFIIRYPIKVVKAAMVKVPNMMAKSAIP